MTNLRHILKNFWNDDEGVTAIEYGLLAALIAVVIIIGAGVLGTNLNALFQKIADCMKTPSSCTTSTPAP